jgi:multiple sugar transport system permease protein
MIAFSDYRFLIPDHQPFNGLNNWYEMWRDATFWASISRAFQYTGYYVVGLVLLGLLGAVLISSFQRQKEASVYRVIAYMPVVLPIAVALLLWRQLLNNQFGYVNHVLRDILGLPAPNWLGDAVWVVPTLAIAAVWKQMGQTILLFLIGIYGINRELYEAAAIDGAGGWKRFRHITLPLLTPIIAVVMTFSVLFTFTDFQLIYVITRGGPLNATHLMATLAFQRAINGGALGEGAAIAITMVPFLLACIMFSFFGLQRRAWQQGGADT